MTHFLNTGRWSRRAALGGAAVLLSASVACSGVLDVEDPQAFGDDDLNSPTILSSVASGAEGLLHQAFDDFIVVTELLGDVMESTSTWIDWEDISEGRVRGNWPSAGSFSGPQNQLLEARFAAANAEARIARVLEAAATTSPLTAQVQFTQGMADLLLGMGWCEGPLEDGGVREVNTKFFPQAVTKLSKALTTAQGLSGADRAAWMNATLAARARANLLAGNNDAALADAQAVAAGFSKLAVFNEGSGRQQSTVGNQFHQNRNRSGGLRRVYHARVMGTSNANTYTTNHLPDWYDNTKIDPRMTVNRKAGELGVNNRFAYYGISKYSDRGGDIPMLTKREMTLIEAEVYFRRGDYTNMTARLNVDRTANGLAAITVPASQAAAQAALLNERLAVLFVEGQRMYDLHRYNLVTSVLGTGRARMLPLSTTEYLNNAKIFNTPAACPVLS